MMTSRISLQVPRHRFAGRGTSSGTDSSSPITCRTCSTVTPGCSEASFASSHQDVAKSEHAEVAHHARDAMKTGGAGLTGGGAVVHPHAMSTRSTEDARRSWGPSNWWAVQGVDRRAAHAERLGAWASTVPDAGDVLVAEAVELARAPSSRADVRR